jgi:hypothetical protein
MKTFAIQFIAMLVGSVLPIWFRAIVQVGSGNFSFRVFWLGNQARFALSAIGVLLFGLLLVFDAGSISTILKAYGLSAEIAAPSVVGFAIASFVLAKSSAPVAVEKEIAEVKKEMTATNTGADLVKK